MINKRTLEYLSNDKQTNFEEKKTEHKNTNFGQNYQIVKTQICQSYQTQTNCRKNT